MRCETIEVNRNNIKTVINLSDFNSETDVKWADKPASAADQRKSMEKAVSEVR